MEATPKAFKDLSLLLSTHFDNSQVVVSDGPGDAKYLHVHQKKRADGLSMAYLPTFHIIGTLEEGILKLKLMTHHGKVITSCGGRDRETPLSVQETLDFFKQLDNAHLCCGISSSKRFQNSFRIAKDDVLIEQFEEQVIFRSRDCHFAVDQVEMACSRCQLALNLMGEDAAHDDSHMEMEQSYHSIFGSDKTQNGFEDLLQYSSLLPNFYATDDDAEETYRTKEAEEEDEEEEPLKEEDSFQNTIEEIANLGLKSDPFVCDQCKATFKTYFGLRKHVTSSGHQSDYHPRCFICLKYFKRAVNLRMHYTSTHLNLRPYKCSQCDFMSATSSSIILHSKSAHSIAAENIVTIDSEIRKLEAFEKRFGIVCMQNRKRKSLKTIHIQDDADCREIDAELKKSCRTKEEKSLVPITCEPEVEQPNDSREKITDEDDKDDISHLDPNRVNSNPFVCDSCNVTAATMYHLKRHVELTNHTTKYFPRCFICFKSFKRLSNLRFHHSSTHLKLRPYKCCHCDYIGTAPSAVVNHAKSLHNAQDDEYITIESEMQKLEAFEAKFGIVAMQKRKRKHDKTIPEMPIKGIKMETGECLDSPEPKQEQLRQHSHYSHHHHHQQQQTAAFFNNVLFQEYLSNLKRMQNVSLTLLQKALINNAAPPSSFHIQGPEVEGKRQRRNCSAPYGPRKRNSKDFDVKTTSSSQVNADPFACDECSQTFSKPHLLRTHLEQSSHRSRTDAKCFVCQKRCSRLSNLRSHYSAVHFNLKPYKCALCEVTASNSSTILTHAKDVHNLETNRFITLESEILKLEGYEKKFGIVCMQKRKRRTLQAVK